MQSIRGRDISMIFQEPMTSLNPVFTVGAQIMEAIILHQKVSKAEARQKTIELLREVGIPEARAARRLLPAPDVRRAEAARDDRDGPLLQPASC